jgi:uncharacterized membrane protein YebE (DUF533 family)
MNTKGLLDQLYKQGSELLSGKGSNPQSTAGGLGGLLSGKSGAALGGGALGLLLGSKAGRKMGGKVLTYGGLAALGVVAYKAYSNWQQQQGNSVSQAQPQTIDRLPPPQAEQHSYAILRAIIGAAKADGHVDDKERELIDNEIARLTNDGELQHWFDAELKKPLDPAEIARSATTPEIAAEMYLASVLVVDEENFMERSYLTELANQLKLQPALKTELEQQARQAAAANSFS